MGLVDDYYGACFVGVGHSCCCSYFSGVLLRSRRMLGSFCSRILVGSFPIDLDLLAGGTTTLIFSLSR